MSREIEFRAWDKKRKRYAKVIQTTDQGWKGYRDKTYITNGIMRFSKWVLSRFIIEQFTGLKDENGKEIYEGDIIKIKQGFYAVVWDYLRAAWGLKYLPKKDEVRFDRDIADMRFMQNNSGLVIGNIHENPELLEGEK